MSRRDLRDRAEERLATSEVTEPSIEDPRGLIHELQVHQIELQMQNDELARSEQELSESRDELLDLYEHAPVAYLTTDPAGIVRAVNMQAEEMLGLPRKSLVGAPLWQFIVREDRDTLHLHRGGLGAETEVRACQLRIQRPDGSTNDVRMQSAVRADKPRVQVALIDETGQRRAEAELRELNETLEERVFERTAEAERRAHELAASQEKLRARESELRQAQKMHAIGRLASGVAHEFNNLLMGIMGSADMCLDAAAEGGELTGLLKRLRESAAGGAEIVQQLMVFGRKDDEAPGTSCLDDILALNERLLRKTLGEDVDFRVVLGARGSHVPCSSVRVGQILMNLAMNARQAMPKGGKLILQSQVLSLAKTTWGSLSGLEEGEYVVLQVRDTGVGMDEKTRTRAFEPFFTTKAVGEGTGIGLSTVYGIADRAGGRVLIDSEVGVGTVVTVVLPVTAAPADTDSLSMALETRDLAGRTVLIVEDDILVRQTLRHYLVSAGIVPMEAQDGEEGLAICREHDATIELVITDIALPKLQGDELARMIDKPVIFVTAYSTDQLRREGRIPPGARALQKPFVASALIDAVRKTLP